MFCFSCAVLYLLTLITSWLVLFVMVNLDSGVNGAIATTGSSSPPLEYDGWRGKAYLDETDLTEIGDWVTELNETQIYDVLKYYWVNNELMYPYGAIVRGMFAIFNEATQEKITMKATFIRGIEVIIHYVLLKSFPVIGRKGGVRGTGQDKVILRAAVPCLITCYKLFAPTQNFTTVVYPIMRRRRKRHIGLMPHVKRPRQKCNRSQTFERQKRNEDDDILETYTTTEETNRNEGIRTSTHVPMTHAEESGSNELETEILENVGTDSDNSSIQGRYAFVLSHGSQTLAKMTKVVVAEDDSKKIENVGVTIFWLIYELVPIFCKWTEVDLKPYKEAFDMILGLVVSMYLYDVGDYAEEYERIFNMTTPQFELEWEKIEFFAKKTQKEKKLSFTNPYSNIL